MMFKAVILASIAFLAFLSAAARKLTPGGAIAGWGIATLLFLGTGLTGVVLLGGFFMLAVAATATGRKVKEQLGVAEAVRGRRNMAQVIANGGMAALAGLAAWILPAYAGHALVVVAAAASSAVSDTVSSELGTVYGKRFYNILTWRSDARGANGVISLEGTLAGLAGSIVIATLFILGSGAGFLPALGVVVAGTLGNLADSLLGASWERSGIVGNNVVNFLNTTVAAAVALIWLWLT
ncbi:MAG: DUF92 domain-containing protein [Flavipsychrobacter sp.]|nr:DUF92 domain-containing protein [Flavipsychrobacter sp.]